MKIWQSQHVFDHPWSTITQAAWRKYPNPNSQNIVAIDVIDREVAPDGALTTHRVFTTKWAFPKWVKSIINISDYCYSTEKSVVHPAAQSMVLESQNVSLGKFISVVERLEYTPHPSDPSKTLLTQEAQISINGLPLVGKLEEAMSNTIAANASKGRQAMEWVVKKITMEAADLGRSLHSMEEI
ncbi:protein slowmo-like [Paramacrobiotus metropolitanus]|uniref:protein slowmo-like n=1 Tax=Paramacrobiotus metropolitanus TaxID=2943436 RepID=UPI002446045C|nr:protein slowmo-like [Paramacrobiotus metropolitanus]